MTTTHDQDTYKPPPAASPVAEAASSAANESSDDLGVSKNPELGSNVSPQKLSVSTPNNNNGPSPRRRLNMNALLAGPSQTPSRSPQQPVIAFGKTSPSSLTRSSSIKHSPTQPETPATRGRAISGSTPTLSAAAKAASEEQDLLREYLSQLAARESKCRDLRLRVSELRQAADDAEAEARSAEAELSRFKRTGNDLVARMRAPSIQSQSAAELSAGALLQPTSRSPSPRRQPPRRKDDVITAGRRMVDEMHQQFWSFLDDVRTATLGLDEEEEENQHTSSEKRSTSLHAVNKQSRPSFSSDTTDDHSEQHEPRERPLGTPDLNRGRTPKLRAKESINNMVDAFRKLSPDRNKPPRNPERRSENVYYDL